MKYLEEMPSNNIARKD